MTEKMGGHHDTEDALTWSNDKGQRGDKPATMRSDPPPDGEAHISKHGFLGHFSDIWKRYRFWFITVANLLTFFTLWEIFARAAIVPEIFFPRFTSVLEALRTGWFGGTGEGATGFRTLLNDFVIARNFWATVQLFGVGVAIAMAVGVPIGLIMGGVRWIDTILSPYIWTLASLPRIAIFPILVLFLGLGTEMKIVLVFITAAFPIIINTWAGVKTADQSLLAAARVFGASRAQRYRKIVLPFTLPFIVVGAQQGLATGLVATILAEFLVSARDDGGLGWLIFRSGETFNSGLTYASLLSLGVFSLLLIQTIRWAEAKIAPWRSGRRV